jgi:hypothetical protein
MANRLQVTLIDDLDGSEAAETVAFALDGKSYEIDLNDANAATLRELLAPYIKAGRSTKATARRRSQQSTSDRDTKAIRAWAQSQGLMTAARGRIPASVIEQYRASA